MLQRFDDTHRFYLYYLQMTSVLPIVLVFVLITAVVSALLAFVILPSISSARQEGEGMRELTIADYVDDINAVNKSGYDYDMAQDKRMDELEQSILDDGYASGRYSDVNGESYPTPNGAFGDFEGDTGGMFDNIVGGIIDNIQIQPPSEAGGVPKIALGPFSADTDFSKFCVGSKCFEAGSPAVEQEPEPPIDDDQPVEGFVAYQGFSS